MRMNVHIDGLSLRLIGKLGENPARTRHCKAQQLCNSSAAAAESENLPVYVTLKPTWTWGKCWRSYSLKLTAKQRITAFLTPLSEMLFVVHTKKIMGV